MLNYYLSSLQGDENMGCPRFDVGDSVKFSPSPFLYRSIGYLASVQLAIKNREIFEVAMVSDFLGDQFLDIVNSRGERPFGSLNAHLFTRT